jgi:hypothetical protein
LWDSRWGIPSALELSLALKRHILTRLAVYLHMANIEQLGDDEIHSFVKLTLPDVGCLHSATEVLDYLRERTGLLIGPGTWSFVHKNVGEFLVAGAIRDGNCVSEDGQKLDRFRLFAERHNDRWNNVLFFWAGLTAPGDLQSFIEQVLAKSKPAESVLALSVIYDQLQPHRLTEPWRTKQVLALFRRDFGTPDSAEIVFICSPAPQRMSTEVDAIFTELRLPERTDLREALWECLKACDIRWKEVANCHSSIFFITWSFFATQAPNREDLRAAVDKEFLRKKAHSEWWMFSATWGIRHTAIGRGDIPLSEFVKILGDSDPHIKPSLPIFLLASFVTLSIGSNRTVSANDLANLLSVLESLKALEPDRTWLKLSTAFADPFEDLETFDVLRESLESLTRNKLMEQIEPRLVSNTRDYVTSLIEKRKQLNTRSRSRTNR